MHGIPQCASDIKRVAPQFPSVRIARYVDGISSVSGGSWAASLGSGSSKNMNEQLQRNLADISRLWCEVLQALTIRHPLNTVASPFPGQVSVHVFQIARGELS